MKSYETIMAEKKALEARITALQDALAWLCQGKTIQIGERIAQVYLSARATANPDDCRALGEALEQALVIHSTRDKQNLPQGGT